MDYLEQAIALAVKAHAGQRDKAGAPYILHPLRLMLQMNSVEEMCAAVLHDVVEDTPLTLDDLRAAGIPAMVVEAVDRLTRRNGELYMDFINRVKGHSIAHPVKLADLKDNMNLLRIKRLSDQDLIRLRRYHESYQTLSSPRP